MQRPKQKARNIYFALILRLLILMGIYTLCRLVFYWMNLPLFPGIEFQELVYMLFGGLKFDVVALLYINLLYIILQSIPFEFRFRNGYQVFCKWLFYITNSAGIVCNIIDLAYYRFSLKRTTFSVFQQFSGEDNTVKLWGKFILDYWYLLFLYILLVALMVFLYNLISIKPIGKFKVTTYALHTVRLVVILALIVIGVRGGWRHSTRPITLSNAGEYVDSPNEMSIVLNTPFTLIKTIKAQKLKIVTHFDEATLKKIYNPVHLPSREQGFKKLNVVFLIVESLGKEHVGALNKQINGGKYRGYTPFLDSLISKSFTFSRSYSNGRKSIDALPSIISGIPSIKEPFVLSSYSGNRTTSIAKLLGDEGYETAFFHGAPNGSMGFSSYTRLAGIKHYYGKSEYNNDADFDGIWGIWDDPFLQFMARTLNTMPQPFFSAAFTVSSHHPFKVPEKYKGKFPTGNLPVQEPIGYTDMALKNFFRSSSSMPWFKNTLFVICADHATVSYLPEYKNISGDFSIPIIFYYPGGDLTGTSDKLIQQIDILPTVLNFLNYPKPYFAFGFDAFSSERSNFVVNNTDGTYTFYQNDFLLLNNGTLTTGIFDLKNDRFMQKDLNGKVPVVQKTMENNLKAFIQQYDNRMIRDQLTLGKGETMIQTIKRPN
ncbi:MAG: alkaline phosphatase family protein [Flavobacterium sp.]|nr:MAG: alkaline phosphatase family protein [Flavobacterium sp.]